MVFAGSSRAVGAAKSFSKLRTVLVNYDTIIKGGIIVDGTGGGRYRGDVGIRKGKIAALGTVDGGAKQVVEADGRVVAPGFVDVHTHYDAQLMWDRMLSISPWHGVTSVVIGNCGFGVAPTRSTHRDLILQTLEKVEGMSIDALRAGLGEEWGFESFPEYLDAIEIRGTAINLAVLVGHTPIRLYVMGQEATERPATADEIAAMRSLVGEAMEAGAVGFSTSGSKTHVGYLGRPVPSRLADFEEIRALVGAMAGTGQGLFQATVGPNMFYDEFSRLHEEFSIPITWTALLGGLLESGTLEEHLARLADFRERKIPIVPQVACRPIMVDFNFREPFLFETSRVFQPISMEPGLDGKMRVYRDLAFRALFKDKFAPGRKRLLAGWSERAVISHFPPQPDLEERLLSDVARERGVDAVDLALDMSLETDLAARFRLGVLNTDEDEVETLLKTPGTLIALSDAGAHASQLCDACYSTHLLGYWVRERGVFTLEQAIHKLTQAPAELFGIHGRGRLAEGMAADIVILDPETVGAQPLRRVHDLPAGADRLVADATGIHLVMVNGTPIRRDGQDLFDGTGPLPGRLLRNGNG